MNRPIVRVVRRAAQLALLTAAVAFAAGGAERADAVIAEIKTLTKQPIRYLR
jgi:hypothetical protein